MNTERWQRLQSLFHAALPLPAKEREELLSAACGEDTPLREQVNRLLAAHERPGGIIEYPIEGAEIPAEDDSVSAVGKQFGPYLAVRELGRGGMGAVYLGERADGQFQQQVAIKVIKRGMDTSQVLARFRAERQILASLDHPNIARLLDGGTGDDGQPYFVMEYIDGEPIHTYAEARALTVTQRLDLFLQVAGAVTYAHQHLIVHRDIKPLNILVTAEGVPKLLDFGIAKVLHAEGEDATVTATGWRLFTPEYASPEQVEGRHATTVSDVYSLGVVLYELLTGQSPYRLKHRTPQDVAVAVRTSDPDRPSTAVSAGGAPGTAEGGSPQKLQRRLRGDLDTIVLAALRKEPQRRYQSVEQFAADVRRHLEGLPVLARPDTFRYRAGKFVRRNRVPVAAGTLVVLALIGGTVATAWQAQEARAAQARAERRFNDVRKLANTVLFDYHDAIKDLRGATPVRERLVRDALGYLDGLAREQEGDPTLQRELASAYRRVGDLQGGDPKALGDSKGAVESYTKALRILENLYRADSTDVGIRTDLAVLALDVGKMVWERGDLAAGLAHARRARAILEPLRAASSGDSTQWGRMHAVYDLLGQMSLEAGDLTQALAFHRADLAQLDRAPPAHRQRPGWREVASISYGHLADVQADANDLAGALESHRHSLELRRGLVAEFPDNAQYDYIAGMAEYYLATVLGRMGRWEEALELLQLNLRRDPTAAFTQFRVGEALAQLGRHAEGLGYLRRALQLHLAEVGGDSSSLFNRMALALDQGGICKTLAHLGRPEAATTCAETAAFITATPVDPTHAFPRAHFGGIWSDLGEAYEALANRAVAAGSEGLTHRIAARDNYRRSHEIWADLTARKLISPIDTFRVAATARAIARTEAALPRR
ncbi:MAG TPA: serine/threonine-protein kinase [Gemmatimonadales bacterium]|nr:serine/threonine-protein kinase [Gemmatimonadales bacterium]